MVGDINSGAGFVGGRDDQESIDYHISYPMAFYGVDMSCLCWLCGLGNICRHI